MDDNRDLSHLFRQRGGIKSRKQGRKQKRQLKKVVRKAYFTRQNIDEVIKSEFCKERGSKKTKAVKKKQQPKSLQSEIEQFRNQALKAQKQRIQTELEEDDREIKYLMKKLGYSKQRTKMPKIFEREGLQLLWDICEGNHSSKTPIKDVLSSQHWDGVKKSKKDEDYESEDEELMSDVDKSDIAESQSEDDDKNTVDEEEDLEETEKDDACVEDIYGRIVDSKTGRVLKGVNANTAQQKLNELNEEDDELTDEKKLVLTKSIRSLLNRLNQSTLFSSVKTMEQLVVTNSQNSVKQVFTEIFSKSINTQAAVTDRLIIEFAGFLLLIHQLISSEISAYFVEKFTLAYLKAFDKEKQERNSLRNSTVLMAHLYNFKVVRAAFLLEIMDHQRLLETPIALNMLCEILTYAGLTLKKRDGSLLSAFIIRLSNQFDNMAEEKLKDDRIGFLVEDLRTLKNSKLAKFTEKFDRSFMEHYQKTIKGLTKQSAEKRENELAFSVKDLLHVAEQGRWWVVGSAFARNSIRDTDVENPTTSVTATKYDESLLMLATKLQMNTELRREIFCTVMSSLSVDDAFERLLKLRKSDHQGRELIYIVVICALYERKYNPFYANLIERFCDYKRNFQLTMQFAVWDRLKQLNDLKGYQQTNLALLIADLIWLEAAQLTLLKVINFGMLNDTTSALLKRTFYRLLLKSSENALAQIFKRILRESSNDKLLFHGLQLFFEVVFKVEDFESEETEESTLILKKRLIFLQGLLHIAG